MTGDASNHAAAEGVLSRRVVDLLRARFKKLGTVALGEDTALFSSGFLDSLSFIQMVVLIEKEFGVRIREEKHFKFQQLDSPRQIAAVIRTLMGS